MISTRNPISGKLPDRCNCVGILADGHICGKRQEVAGNTTLIPRSTFDMQPEDHRTYHEALFRAGIEAEDCFICVTENKELSKRKIV